MNNDNFCILCIKKYILTKYSLLILIIPFWTLFLIDYVSIHFDWALPIIVFFSTLIVFLLFPELILAIHKRPIYYNDLKIHSFENKVKSFYTHEQRFDIENNIKFREKYQLYFRLIVTVISSVTIATIIDLFILRNQDSFDIKTRIGLAGGLIKIYSSVQTNVGSMLLSVLKMLKSRELRRNKPDTTFYIYQQQNINSETLL